MSVVQRRGKRPVEIVPGDDHRVPAEALEQHRQLLIAHRPVDRRVGDLVAVDVQDREHRPARCRVEELVRVPRAGRRPGLGLAVADDAGDDQVRIVERGAERGRERVTELTAFVDRARDRGRQVAGEAARPREVPNEASETFTIARELGLDVLQTAVDPQVCEVRRRAVARTGYQQHARIGLEDQPVQPGIDEVDPGYRAPVAEQAGLYVVGGERFLEQGITLQIDHRRGDVVGRAPVDCEPLDARRWCLGCHRVARSFV